MVVNRRNGGVKGAKTRAEWYRKALPMKVDEVHTVRVHPAEAGREPHSEHPPDPVPSDRLPASKEAGRCFS